jgi:tRNA A37 threonylcarbamoyladenosine dehydratase
MTEDNNGLSQSIKGTQALCNLGRRFGGIARLYGDVGLTRLSRAHVCVVGIGGVGSWVAESLARSAVGEISLIDLDVVSESNINRQLVATSDNVVYAKVPTTLQHHSTIVIKVWKV